MRTLRVGLLLGGLCLAGFAQTRYEANWESLDKRQTPAWFTDAKFGIFIHWGVYAVPSYAPAKGPGGDAYAEWYWNHLKQGPTVKGRPNATWDFHRKNYGEGFDYPEFAAQFRAEMFDPARWASVFERSGAKYVVLTSKHHEGFPLWPDSLSAKAWGRPWNAMETGPKRDLLGDLSAEVRKTGLKMGYYYSLYEWYNPLWLADRKKYAVEYMQPQFQELVSKYKPSILFSDGEWDMPSSDWQTPKLMAWLFNDSPVKDEVVINDRWGKDTRHKHGSYYTTEYTAGLEGNTHPWEENRGMGYSYGYNRAESLEHYRSERELILMLADLVSRGGNLLLDIGPTADGRIPVIMEERLLQMGKWLKANGESIYGTKAWVRTRQWSAGNQPKLETGEFMTRYEVTDYVERKKPGQAVIETFFTAKGQDVYAIIPGWPGTSITIRDVKAPTGMRPTLLESGKELKWKASGNGVTIQMPPASGDALNATYAYVIKLPGLLSR